jgi:hypothetical protein
VGRYKPGVWSCGADPPWNIPAQRSIAQVVAFAHKGGLGIFELGYFKVKAVGNLAPAGAYCFCRLKHQTSLDEAVAGRLCPMKLEDFLTIVGTRSPFSGKPSPNDQCAVPDMED